VRYCLRETQRILSRLLVKAAALLLTGLCFAQDGPVAAFGTTVIIPSGLRGDVYFIPSSSKQLPKFKKLKPVGAVYTNSLNIQPREFTEGFPGITDRNEWFAIDYTGRFWIETPGKYNFALESDDGSKRYIDGKRVIDNDGIHPTRAYSGSAKLSGGIHGIRVSYFQGPRTYLALVLAVKGPDDDDYRVFSTTEFKPPSNPADWKYGTPDDLEKKPGKR
jgi:hypothetical protein